MYFLSESMYLENSINGRMISRTRSLVAFPQSSTSRWVAFLHSLILYPDSLQEWISIFLMSPPKIPWPDLVGCPVPFSPFKPGVASLASIGLAEISTWHTWLIEFWYCTDTVWSIPESQIQGTRTNWYQPLRKSKRARVGAQLTLVWRGHFFHTYIHSSFYQWNPILGEHSSSFYHEVPSLFVTIAILDVIRIRSNYPASKRHGELWSQTVLLSLSSASANFHQWFSQTSLRKLN